MLHNSNKKNFEEALKKAAKNDKDDDQNFIKKDDDKNDDDKKNEKKSASENFAKHSEQDAAIKNKYRKNLIKPTNDQQRNLSIENGGLEQEEQKEIHVKDVWDDRGEEIKKMSVDVFNTTGMKSLIWKQKREKIAAEKHHQKSAEALGIGALTGKKRKNNQKTSDFDDMSYVEKLKHMKLDRSHENGGRNI
ncbi:MAG: hypothetical protein SFV53_03580 [Rickettsiales bacterium]|nr:hypothetical protein [Rickettsiales bacterium]